MAQDESRQGTCRTCGGIGEVDASEPHTGALERDNCPECFEKMRCPWCGGTPENWRRLGSADDFGNSEAPIASELGENLACMICGWYAGHTGDRTKTFEVDEHGRPVVFGKSAGNALDGWSIGPGDSEEYGSAYVNYVVVPETGMVFIETVTDTPTYVGDATQEVVPLYEAEDTALNMLYAEADGLFENAVWLEIPDDEAREAAEETERTIAELKENIRQEIAVERSRDTYGDDPELEHPVQEINDREYDRHMFLNYDQDVPGVDY